MLFEYRIFYQCDLVTEKCLVLRYDKATIKKEVANMKIKRKPMKLAAVDQTRCVACGVCENTCPLGAVKVRRGCYAAVEAERCVGCGKCAKLCPVGCIEVKVRADV